MSILKNIRIIFSSIYLILFFGLFLKVEDILLAEYFFNNTQIVPLIIKIFIGGYFISLIFLFLIILITLIFGRVYCSFLCPLGILQDFFIFIKNKIKKTQNEYFKDLYYIHYFFLTVFIILLLLKKASFIGFLDPYAIFGKITSNIFLPILFLIFSKFNIYIFPEIHKINLILFIYVFAFFMLIIFFNIFFNRLYCNLICPVGALLRILSKISIFKMTVDEKCIKCGLCEVQCKANCIDVTNNKIDNERCIRCFNCINNCKKYLIKFNPKVKLVYDENRRELIKAISFFILFSIVKVDNILGNFVKIKKKNLLITPPGSGSIERFNEKCIACHLCITNCPTKVLTPAIYEYGINGIFQPKMDYEKSYCLYECNICSQVCPTEAIKRLEIKEKKKIQIGVAKFVKENCIVTNRETDCGVCSEFCPTKAVKLVRYKNELFIPFINEKICVGCGACENVCPAQPFKAIYVEGNNPHKNIELKRRQNSRQRAKYENFF